MALERIVLNIIPAGEMPVFHCSQYENGRPVIIDLVSSDDDAFLVPEGATVELHCRKVDDNIVTLEPDEVDNNTVTFVSTEQLTACPGDNLCEVVLYADTDPIQTIATLNFILHVEPDPLEGGLTSDTQIYNLTEQIEEITQQVIGDDYYDKTEVDSALALKADKADTYTKTQVDNALALKANTSELATVATTGDYDDLINKPTIPAAQVQSDYAQADNTQVDYIKNKPDINAMIAAALLAVMPVGTESGPIVSFDTEIAAPLVNVSCDIVATGGNGTPDNPNPITGYSSANITRCGVNLWDEEWELGGINGETGQDFTLNTAIRSKGYTPVKGNVSLYYHCDVSGLQFRICYYDANKVFISSLSVTNINQAYTTPANCAYIRFAMRDTYGTTYNNDISINYPATDTTYHAYNGQTYAIAFGQTVYGGVLDVTRGKLTVENVKLTLNGTEAWGNYPAYNGVSLVIDNMKSGNFMNGICSHFATLSAHGHGIRFGANNNNLIYCEEVYTDISGVTDVDSWKTWLSNNNIDIVYPLATPFDIDLTPEVISAIIGTNNVYSDTGNTTVQYKDSIQHYIDTRI